MNRINKLFEEKQNNIMSVYFSAGFPRLEDTVPVIKALEKHGVDLVEIGMPFSDPLADGPVIQQSNHIALQNGMSLNILFNQLENIRKEVSIPLILMGYLNPVMQYGMKPFLEKCSQIGIDGIILPDLPYSEYVDEHKPLFEKFNIHKIFLITPQTSDERLKSIDEISKGFIYVVSSASTTGVKENIIQSQEEYFGRINSFGLKNPRLIGFGISNYQTYSTACKYANGVIIGSAFIKALSDNSANLDQTIETFVHQIKNY